VDLMSLKDKYVVLIFHEPIEVNGVLVRSVGGTFGGGTLPGFFALNDIRTVMGADKTNVTDAVGLRGKIIMGRSENIQTVISGPAPE